MYIGFMFIKAKKPALKKPPLCNLQPWSVYHHLPLLALPPPGAWGLALLNLGFIIFKAYEFQSPEFAFSKEIGIQWKLEIRDASFSENRSASMIFCN